MKWSSACSNASKSSRERTRSNGSLASLVCNACSQPDTTHHLPVGIIPHPPPGSPDQARNCETQVTYEHGHLPQPTRGPFTSRSVHSLFGCGHNTHHRRRPFDLDSKTALGQLVCQDARNPGGVLAGLPRFGRSPIAVEQVQRAAWPQEALDEVQLLRRATDPEEIGAALADNPHPPP